MLPAFQVDQMVKILLEWCVANSIFIDSQICIAPDEKGGIGVYSKERFIPPKETLVIIPKDAILSVRTCSLVDLIPIQAYGLGAQLSLSVALYAEMLRGIQSRWHGYIQSLPSGIVDLPVFWSIGTDENHDNSEAIAWLRGTETSKILNARTENCFTTLEEINSFYRNVGEPLLLGNACISASIPTIAGFHRAFSLVSSRAFLVDAYHGLALVPIADAFNHVLENHVHLETDYDVCPDCGSLQECTHDNVEYTEGNIKTSKNVQPQDASHDIFYEMVTTAGIPPDNEIFNTYGEDLTNAQLLNQYGFVLDINDNDRLSWSRDEILDLFLPDEHTETDKRSLLEHYHDTLSFFDKTLTISTQPRLVYYELSPVNHLHLNDEGSLSHQLWSIFFVLSLHRDRRYITKTDLRLTIETVLELQEKLTSFDSNNEDENNTVDENSSRMLDHSDGPALNILLNIGQMCMALCVWRKQNSGRPEFRERELSSVLEEIPEDRVHTQLAISILMSEQSRLDCCHAAWDELTKVIISVLHEFG